MSETELRPPVHALHHHPAVKWVLMVAILCTAGLSLPRSVMAAAPSVQPPTGPQSGGVFTGAFSFLYYINCTNGVSFNSTYTSNLDGTNTFRFYGAADGSLLLSINGGGQQLISSCGDPYTGNGLVNQYTVSKNTAPPPTPTPPPTPPPTPTPTPPPVVTPTPPPVTGGGSTGGGSSGGNHATPTPTRTNSQSGSPPTTTEATPGASPPVATVSPDPSSTPTAATGSSTTQPSPSPTIKSPTAPHSVTGAWVSFAFLLALIVLIAVALYEFPHHRKRLVRVYKLIKRHLLSWWAWTVKMLRNPVGVTETRRRGLAHHQHSGKLLAHHHTSYPALAFLLVISGVLVAAIGSSGFAADSTLSLTVGGPPPTQGADITAPADGASFTTALITVQGTCPSGLRVELSRNGTFAGSTICDGTGHYSLVISLVDGSNLLLASDYDGANQAGPATSGVTVTYTAPPPTPTPTPTPTPVPTHTPGPTATPGGTVRTPTPTPKPSSPPKSSPAPVVPALPVSIDAGDHYFSGLNPGTPFTWTTTIGGGVPPYNIAVDWGDGEKGSQLLASPGQIGPTHTFSTPGIYHISLTVTDVRGHKAYLSVIVVVNGTPPAISGNATRGGEGELLAIAWPVLAGVALIVFCFWLGERDRAARERRRPAFAGV